MNSIQDIFFAIDAEPEYFIQFHGYLETQQSHDLDITISNDQVQVHEDNEFGKHNEVSEQPYNILWNSYFLLRERTKILSYSIQEWTFEFDIKSQMCRNRRKKKKNYNDKRNRWFLKKQQNKLDIQYL